MKEPLKLRPHGMALFSVLALSACGGSTGSAGLIDRSDDIVSALDAYDAVYWEVDDLLVAEGATRAFEAPTTEVTYTGLIFGYDSEEFFDGPLVAYVANLSLDVDFDTGGVDGEVGTFVTDLAEFEAPSGIVTLEGGLGVDPDGFVTIDFSGDSTLSQGRRVANIFISGDGYFAGDDADGTYGSQWTDLDWIVGPDTGTVTFADGTFDALR